MSTGLTRHSQDAHHSHEGRSSLTGPEIRQTIEDSTLDPAHPRELPAATTTLSSQVYRQLLGLNPFRSSFLSLYRNLENHGDRTYAIGGFILAVAAGVPLPIMFVIFGQVINAFPPTEDEIRIKISEMLGVAVAYFVVTTLYMTAFGRVGEKIAIKLREDLLKCFLNLDQAYYDTHELDVTGLLTSKIETIQVGTSEKVGIFIQSMSYFFAAFIVGFILNARLTGILLAAIIPTMIIIVSLGSTWVSKLSKRASENSEGANGVVECALRAIKVVQAYDIMGKMDDSYKGHLQASAVASVKKAIVAACMLGAMYFAAFATNGLAFFLGGHIAQSSGKGEAGTVYAVCLLILDASFVVGQFAPFLEIFAKAASAGGEISALLEESKGSAEKKVQNSTAQQVSLRGQPIHFEAVEFSYPARPTVKALRGMDLTFHSGTFNAVVGTSGGGKSTLISLLMGIYDDYSGRILIGEHDLRCLDTQNTRSQVSVVEQDCVLFSGTLFDNICHGLVGMSVDQTEKERLCAKAVEDAAVNFLDSLPDGLQTVVDNTLQLSGGQKQRICLARALVKQPAVLVLDEPTSALDAQSEMMIAATVKRIAESGTTVIMVAHRLSTVLGSDCLVVMSDGKVAESGSPEELSQPGTVFHGLLKAQGTEMPSPGVDTPTEAADEKTSASALASALNASLETMGPVGETDTSPMGSWAMLATTYRFLKPDILMIGLGLLASMVSGAIIVGEAITFGNLIELLNNTDHDGHLQHSINFYCLMFFVIACVALVAYICSGSAFGVASARVTVRVQRQIFHTLLRQDMQWFAGTGRSVHELLSTTNSDAGALASLSGVALGTLCSIMVSMTSGIVLSLAIAWKVAVVLLSCVPVLIAAGYLRLRILTKSEEHHRSSYTQAANIAAESCRNIRTVVILGLEDDVLNRYKEALEKPFKNGVRFTVASNALLAASFAITYFVYSLAYWWGSKQVREGYCSSKDFFIILPALLFSAQGAGQAFSYTPEITRARSAVKSICGILNDRPTILTDESEATRSLPPSASSSKEGLSSDKPSAISHKVHFANVALAYPSSGGKRAIQNVTLSVEEGQNVALVGPSGAGKSSVVALLERYYDPSAGSITIDGVDLREINASKLRARMSLVPQEPELFPGTIAHNIRLGAASGQVVLESDLEDVCKACGLHDFVVSLPEGYNTECTSVSSSKLSGGQKQRLAIARAMIRNPEILLLDEPTSALDAHSERQVQDALAAASSGRTTVTVAHRLASIQHSDRIFVFDQGRVVEEGSHSDLIQIGGLYASMAKAQSLA